jgi:hypothetical protein
MKKQTALRLLKDLNQIIKFGELRESDFMIILKNYVKVEE